MHHLPYLSYLDKTMKYKNFHRAVQSNNVVWAGFSHGKCSILFFKTQQRYLHLDLNKGKFIKNFSLMSFIWIVPIFFSYLVPDIVYRKIAAAFFLYLLIFKLNIKLTHCCSIFGVGTNQKSLDTLFVMYSVTCFKASLV